MVPVVLPGPSRRTGAEPRLPDPPPPILLWNQLLSRSRRKDFLWTVLRGFRPTEPDRPSPHCPQVSQPHMTGLTVLLQLSLWECVWAVLRLCPLLI